MEAKNFRIGNLIYVKPTNGSRRESRIDGDDLSRRNWDLNSRFLFPIPINEKWLVRLGFIKKDDCEGWHKEGVVYYKGFICDAQRFKIKYVHELQNLFFAITGEELELKKEV